MTADIRGSADTCPRHPWTTVGRCMACQSWGSADRLTAIKQQLAECEEDHNELGFYGYIDYEDVKWLVQQLERTQ